MDKADIIMVIYVAIKRKLMWYNVVMRVDKAHHNL